MPIYILKDCLQLLAVAGLIVLSVFGVHDVARVSKEATHKIFLWVIGLIGIALSASIIVQKLGIF